MAKGKKDSYSKHYKAAKQAKYRLKLKEAQRELRLVQLRCANRVRALQEIQGEVNSETRTDEMFGVHLELCPFNENDPEMIDKCVANIDAAVDDFDDDNNDDYESALEEQSEEDGQGNENEKVYDSDALKNNEKVIRKLLKRKLAEVKDLNPDDDTPEFDNDEILEYHMTHDGQSLDTPTFENSKRAKYSETDEEGYDIIEPVGANQEAVIINDESVLSNRNQERAKDFETQKEVDEHETPDLNATEAVSNHSKDGDGIVTTGIDCSSQGSSNTSQIFIERAPVMHDTRTLDFDANLSNNDEGDDQVNADTLWSSSEDEIENEIEEVYYDCEEELEEERQRLNDPREDNAILVHGTTKRHFQNALEEEENLPTQQEKDYALYSRFFFLISILACTFRQARVFWNFACAFTTRKLLTFKAIRKRFEKQIPKITMTYEFYDVITKEVRHHVGTTFPRKKYPRPRYLLLSEWSNVSMEDLYNFFLSVHPNDFKSEINGKKYIDLFLDGVPLCKSSDALMNVLCVRFNPCRKVWPLSIHVYRKGKSTDIVDLCSQVLQECLDKKFIVRKFIGDSPMRAKMKSLTQHNGYCSCEICKCQGRYLEDYHKMSFPADTYGAPKRTHQEWLQTALNLSENPLRVPKKKRFGIKGYSPLLDLPYFDIIQDFLPDPMHNIALGVCRQLMQCILETKGSAVTSTKGVSIANAFDEKWVELPIPREFPRRPRAIKGNFAHLKASEFIAIACCGFTLFADALLPWPKGLRKVWLRFSWIVHAALMPDIVYKKIMNDEKAFQLHKTFYLSFEKVIGASQCSFNIHTFSHLLEIRKLGPLSDFSAMPFESFFSYLKKIIKPYTLSFAKQCLLKSFICNMNTHSCGYKVSITPNTKKRCIDNLIGTVDGKFYFVHNYDEEFFECSEIKTTSYITPECPELNWDEVMVKVVDRYDSELVDIQRKDAIFKGVIADNIIISVPNDVYFT